MHTLGKNAKSDHLLFLNCSKQIFSYLHSKTQICKSNRERKNHAIANKNGILIGRYLTY